MGAPGACPSIRTNMDYYETDARPARATSADQLPSSHQAERPSNNDFLRHIEQQVQAQSNPSSVRPGYHRMSEPSGSRQISDSSTLLFTGSLYHRVNSGCYTSSSGSPMKSLRSTECGSPPSSMFPRCAPPVGPRATRVIRNCLGKTASEKLLRENCLGKTASEKLPRKSASENCLRVAEEKEALSRKSSTECDPFDQTSSLIKLQCSNQLTVTGSPRSPPASQASSAPYSYPPLSPAVRRHSRAGEDPQQRVGTGGGTENSSSQASPHLQDAFNHGSSSSLGTSEHSPFLDASRRHAHHHRRHLSFCDEHYYSRVGPHPKPTCLPPLPPPQPPLPSLGKSSSILSLLPSLPETGPLYCSAQAFGAKGLNIGDMASAPEESCRLRGRRYSEGDSKPTTNPHVVTALHGEIWPTVALKTLHIPRPPLHSSPGLARSNSASLPGGPRQAGSPMLMRTRPCSDSGAAKVMQAVASKATKQWLSGKHHLSETRHLSRKQHLSERRYLSSEQHLSGKQHLSETRYLSSVQHLSGKQHLSETRHLSLPQHLTSSNSYELPAARLYSLPNGPNPSEGFWPADLQPAQAAAPATIMGEVGLVWPLLRWCAGGVVGLTFTQPPTPTTSPNPLAQLPPSSSSGECRTQTETADDTIARYLTSPNKAPTSAASPAPQQDVQGDTPKSSSPRRPENLVIGIDTDTDEKSSAEAASAAEAGCSAEACDLSDLSDVAFAVSFRAVARAVREKESSRVDADDKDARAWGEQPHQPGSAVSEPTNLSRDHPLIGGSIRALLRDFDSGKTMTSTFSDEMCSECELTKEEMLPYFCRYSEQLPGQHSAAEPQGSNRRYVQDLDCGSSCDSLVTTPRPLTHRLIKAQDALEGEEASSQERKQASQTGAHGQASQSSGTSAGSLPSPIASAIQWATRANKGGILTRLKDTFRVSKGSLPLKTLATDDGHDNLDN